MKKYGLITLLSCVLLAGPIQSNPIDSTLFQVIYDECPDADIIEVEQKETFVELEYLCEGDVYEVGVRAGKIFYKEIGVPIESEEVLQVRAKVKKKFPDWELDEISYIETNDTSFYKAEIVKGGIEQNLFFTRLGKKYRSKDTYISSLWTLEALQQNEGYPGDYSVLAPQKTWELPMLLREVSGIALYDSATVLCVQDELGVVFRFNLSTSEVIGQYRFTDIGDFEDVTILGESVVVLRSDGTLFTFDLQGKRRINNEVLSVSALNFESITHHNGRMYVVSKDAETLQADSLRTVYSFKNGRSHRAKKAFTMVQSDINQNLIETYDLALPRSILFNPSAMAVHPITGEYFILSAIDRLLVVYDGAVIQTVMPLPAELYYKPEGLSFFPNGDLLISSEGDKKGLVPGMIHLIEYSVRR